jgi:hypothetical protein
LSQKALEPMPMGEMMPMPVMTTLRMYSCLREGKIVGKEAGHSTGCPLSHGGPML